MILPHADQDVHEKVPEAAPYVDSDAEEAACPQAAAGVQAQATWAEIAARAPQAGGNIAPPPGLHDGADKAATWAGTSRAARRCRRVCRYFLQGR